MNNIRVLIIDDDNLLRFNIEMYFLDEGFKVKSAENAEIAFDLLNSDIIDIAIVDIRLPVMDGEEFIIKASKMYPKLKYIIYTGSTKYKLPDELKALGLTDSEVFNKPIDDMKKLVDKIKIIFGNE